MIARDYKTWWLEWNEGTKSVVINYLLVVPVENHLSLITQLGGVATSLLANHDWPMSGGV